MEMTAGARGARCRRAATPIFPEELIVWEILVRLPAEALLRCRAVCRSWRRLTSADDFLLAHHQRQPSLPLVCFEGVISDVANAAVEAFNLRGAPATAERRTVLRFHNLSYSHGFKVYASCDGLLLLSISSGAFYYICNPATRQWNALPSLDGADIAGLYPHALSREYRILYRRRGYPELDSSAYRVLTVGFSAEARCIGLPVASPSSLEFEQYIADGWMLYVSEGPPVFHHSCLHWVLHSTQEKALIVFDTVTESFRRICSPATSNWRSSAHLLEMDGKLGFSKIDESEMILKLWVLQDYEMEVWSFKYQIELPIVKMRSIAKNDHFEVMVVSGKGDVLVSCSSSSHPFHCDSKGKLVQKFRWNNVCKRHIGHWFKESLVKHEFFQGQDGGHVVQPPFFQGFF